MVSRSAALTNLAALPHGDEIMQTIQAKALDRIAGLVQRLMDGYTDTSNIGPETAECFIYGTIAKHAAKRHSSLRDQVFAALDSIPDTPGEHAMAITDHFVLTAKVSEPVRKFNLDEFVLLLTEHYPKTKVAVVKDCYNRAKIPGKSSVTRSIAERNGE